MFSGESQSWEDAQLVIISHDIQLLDSFQTLKYINVAFVTLLVYDYCLTFNIEKRRMWTLRWRLPKCLFLFNRYILPPIFLVSPPLYMWDRRCDARIFMPIMTSTAMLTVELMLILRVLALYGNSSGMARLLVIQFSVQLLVSSLMMGFLLSRTRSIMGQHVFTGCLYAGPNWGPLAWAPVFFVESTLVILMIYKCRSYEVFTPTIKILARDSIIYFIGLTGIIGFNIFYTRRHQLTGMTAALPTSVLASIAAARLSMNIRAITVERGIATLAEQTVLFSSRGSRNTNSTGVGGVNPSSVEGVPAQQEEEEVEGGYDDDDEDEGSREEWDEAIRQGPGDTRV